MRILVTGGLGAVGAPMARLLRERGEEVWAQDRSHHHGENGRYFFRADVGEYRQMENVFDRAPFDFVYHAAAEFGRINGEDFYETMWKTNAVGTKNLIRLQEKHRFTWCSSRVRRSTGTGTARCWRTSPTVIPSSR